MRHTTLITVLIALTLAGTAHGADLKVSVKRGSLNVVSSDFSELLDLTIAPTATGLTLTPGGTTTINGSGDPFMTDEVTKDWKFKIKGGSHLDLDVTTPDPNFPSPPRKITFGSGGLDLSIDGLQIQSGVKIKAGTSNARTESPTVVLNDCAIGGPVKIKYNQIDTAVRMTNTNVAGKVSVKIKENFIAFDPSAVSFDTCQLDSLSLTNKSHRTDLSACETTIDGKATVKGLVDVSMEGGRVNGGATIKGSNLTDTHDFSDMQIPGTLKIDTGGDNDTVGLFGGAVGRLDVKAKDGDDALTVVGTTLGEKSRFDGSSGTDTFTGDETALDLKNVENTNPEP